MSEKPDPTYEEEQALLELKREIRSKVRVRRRESDPDWIIKASERIQRGVMQQKEYQAAKTVGCYQALPYEVQTHKCIEECRKQGRQICIPAYNEEQKRYELIWMRENDPMINGRWNIPEPKQRELAGLMDVDCIIVPAVAYDRHGGRLGHGGGHYDRMLGAWSGFKIGVAFDFQVLDTVPQGSQDIPVDLVITETHMYTPDGPVEF